MRRLVTYYQQKAELPGIKEAMPEYGEVHSQVLQDVVQRVDRAFQAFFRRIVNGRHPAIRASTGATATTASPIRKLRATAARLDNGFLVLSKIGRIAVRWSRPLEGTPKTVTIGGKRTAGMSVSPAPMCRCSHCRHWTGDWY